MRSYDIIILMNRKLLVLIIMLIPFVSFGQTRGLVRFLQPQVKDIVSKKIVEGDYIKVIGPDKKTTLQMFEYLQKADLEIYKRWFGRNLSPSLKRE